MSAILPVCDNPAIIGCMRRLLVPIVFLLMACRMLIPSPDSTPPSLPNTPTPKSTKTPTKTATATLIVTSPTPSALSATKTPNPTSKPGYTILLHPDGPLYVGDLISLEVIPPTGADVMGYDLQVQIPEAQETKTVRTGFAGFGIANRQQATLLWTWDTTGLQAGEYTLTFSILPDGTTWSQHVELLPQEVIPPPEPEAAWRTAESDCCLLYYISGTEAERDLAMLEAMADEEAQKAVLRMGIELDAPIGIIFLPRVLGHGGFASNEISISYLDRNYAGSSPEIVLHHEIIHILDSRLGGELRPVMLVEGLAVYLTGGHFKKEALMPRAAALLPPFPGCILASPGSVNLKPGEVICSLDWYIPLRTLADSFYFEQHEIGYLQAGALVEFMVETWGWEKYDAFYRDIHPQTETAEPGGNEGGPQYLAMEAAVQNHFGLSMQQLEERFIQALNQEALPPTAVEDVRLTVEMYDTVRRYQQLFDPSAYFLTAWLADSIQMRERGIVADYLRHPSKPQNITIETLLVEAFRLLKSEKYSAAAEMLGAVKSFMDSFTYQANSLVFNITNLLWQSP